MEAPQLLCTISSFLSSVCLSPRACPSPQFTNDLHKHPEILNASDNNLLRSFIDSNFSLPNASALLQQLDTIDNAACGWIQFMAKVRATQPLGAKPGPCQAAQDCWEALLPLYRGLSRGPCTSWVVCTP